MSNIPRYTKEPVGKSGELLTQNEAAQYLGVTPELLFYYTSSRFRKRPEDGRRLEAREVRGQTQFARSELDSFDKYLREPWADSGEKRREVPAKILAYLHVESGGACVRCHKGVGIQTAHIEPWEVSHCNHHHNLLRICSACHDEHDLHNSLSTEELKTLKSRCVERIRTQLERRTGGGSRCSLPAPDPLFVGRSNELLELRDALRTERFLLIQGVGGIGKTELVLKAFAIAGTMRPVYWIDVERYGSFDAVHAALEVLIRDQCNLPADLELAEYLDAEQACLVLDGWEQMEGSQRERAEDWLVELRRASNAAQLLVTTQVDIQRPNFNFHLVLHGIEAADSWAMIEHLVRSGTPVDAVSKQAISSIAEGHPLTLRIAAMLVNYYGSGHAAQVHMKRRGAEVLKVPKRVSHDKRTSLQVCLSLAYDALGADEQRVLFLVANSPGGLFSYSFELGKWEISDGPEAIAGARRWNLLRASYPGEPHERLFALSPIAQFVKTRWQVERAEESRRLLKELASHLAATAAVIENRSRDPAETPYVLTRLQQEYPNFLRVFDLAERYPEDEELSLFTGGFCSTLMQYFFILRMGEEGCRVMLRGMRIALRDGRVERASTLLARMMSLAERGGVHEVLPLAINAIEEIEARPLDPVTESNLAIVRALLARTSGDFVEMESHAHSAVDQIKARLEGDERISQTLPERNLEDIDSDLSDAYNLLGDALLAQQRHADASKAYRSSLLWLRGGSWSVNAGQLLHQIGNCESCAGNHEAAGENYAAAAQIFFDIDMKEYLSNALGELGHTILAGPDSQAVPPDSDVIERGLIDVAEHVERCYSKAALDMKDCGASIRKLFGVFVVASLYGRIEGLNMCATSLRQSVFALEHEDADEIEPNVQQMIWSAGFHLDVLLMLAETVVEFERRASSSGPNAEDVEKFARACHYQGRWADIRRLSFEWLSLYLRKRWSVWVGSAEKLSGACVDAADGQPFVLPAFDAL